MRKELATVVSLSFLSLACGAPQVTSNEVAMAALGGRCQAVTQEFARASAEGRHVPVSLYSRGAEAKALTEVEFAAQLSRAAPGGETLVLARAGTGKSHLSWAIQAMTCEKLPTVHVALAKELAPLFITETAERPALAQFLFQELGGPIAGDPAAGLRQFFGGQPWLLIIDGADELTPSERKKLAGNLAWLRKAELGQHLLRLERPGFEGADRPTHRDNTYDLADLGCGDVDQALQRRWPDEAKRSAALAFLARHKLDRKIPDGACKYVHLTTWRDVEVAADLADDVGPDREDNLPADPTRADLHREWLLLKLRNVRASGEATMAWLDRIVALGVIAGLEPDLVLSDDRCMRVNGPDGPANAAFCGALLKSTAVKQTAQPGAYIFRNQSIADLLLARWMVEQYKDCGALAGAAAAHGSLEVSAMVAATQPGRMCLSNLAAALCSQGLPAAQVAATFDEATPLGFRDPVVIDRLTQQAASPCERRVMAQLQRLP